MHSILLALPDFFDMITQGGKFFDFRSCLLTNIMHGFILMNGMFHVMVWEAIYTAVVKTALKLVDGTCLCVVAVYQVYFLSHLLFFFRLCFLHGQFEADGWFCGVLILPSKAILEQYEIGCDSISIHIQVQWQFCFSASNFFCRPHYRQRQLLCNTPWE